MSDMRLPKTLKIHGYIEVVGPVEDSPTYSVGPIDFYVHSLIFEGALRMSLGTLKSRFPIYCHLSQDKTVKRLQLWLRRLTPSPLGYSVSNIPDLAPNRWYENKQRKWRERQFTSLPTEEDDHGNCTQRSKRRTIGTRQRPEVLLPFSETAPTTTIRLCSVLRRD